MIRLDDNEMGLIIIGVVVAFSVFCILGAGVILKTSAADLEKIVLIAAGLVSTLVGGVLGYMKGKSDAEKAALAASVK